MISSMTAQELLDTDFLEIRCRLLDIAASLDRIDAARESADVANDERLTQIREALRLLAQNTPDRATSVQMIFSDAYDENWRS